MLDPAGEDYRCTVNDHPLRSACNRLKSGSAMARDYSAPGGNRDSSPQRRGASDIKPSNTFGNATTKDHVFHFVRADLCARNGMMHYMSAEFDRVCCIESSAKCFRYWRSCRGHDYSFTHFE